MPKETPFLGSWGASVGFFGVPGKGIAALVMAFGAPPSRPRAAAGDVLPFKATERTLANGLKVIVVPTGFPNLVSIEIPVQVGSRNEVEPGKSGFAHFFEHLMFRGTPDIPPEKYRAIMARAGARDNASTGDDRTHYYATFAKEHLDEVILSTYADMFQHLAYSESDFKTEARAILGEYNKNSADPTEKLIEVQRDQFYQAHPTSTRPWASSATSRTCRTSTSTRSCSSGAGIARSTRRGHRGRRHTRAGPPARGKVLGWVEGGRHGADPDPPGAGAQRPALRARAVAEQRTLAYVTIAFPTPAFSETMNDLAAIDLLGSLYFGPTSELYKRLVVSEQKVDALDVSLTYRIDPSLFTVVARVKKPADALYVRDQILATFAAARVSTPPAQELADTKSHERYVFTRTLDSTERIATVVARYAAFRRSYETSNNHYRTMDSVTPADVRRVARKYVTDAGMMVTTLSNEPLPAGIERLPSLDSLKPAVAFGAPAVRREPAALPTAAWAKGTALPRLVIQKSVLPQLDIKLLFTVGSAHDPAGKEGLAALTAAMIAKAGSRPLTIDQIDALLYPRASS